MKARNILMKSLTLFMEKITVAKKFEKSRCSKGKELVMTHECLDIIALARTIQICAKLFLSCAYFDNFEVGCQIFQSVSEAALNISNIGR